MAYRVAADLTENAFKQTPGFFSTDDTELLPEYIQGKRVRSKPEARVVMALEYYDIGYTYQYVWRGGSRIRGGQVIDILAHTVPMWTPIYVMGKYWHNASKEYQDKIKIQEFTKSTRGKFKAPVIIWDYEAMTIEQARATVKGRIL